MKDWTKGMIWVGLTGGIASGKTTAASILSELGYVVVDADKIAHQVVQLGTPGLKSVVQNFGPQVLSPDGSLNRKKMAAIVFNNPKELQRLESLLHPLVKNQVVMDRQKAESAGNKVAFYDVPLLFEKKMKSDFDSVILISCSEDVQQQRLKSRNHMSDDEITARLKNQIPLTEKAKWSTYVVHNEGSLQDLKKHLVTILDQILQKAESL